MPPLEPKRWRDLIARMDALQIREADLEERFVLGSGKGGQKVNRTAGTVYLRHVPSGREVKCGEERSQRMNRYRARQRLCEMVEAERESRRLAAAAQRARARYAKRKPSPVETRRRVEGKRLHSRTKQLRHRPGQDE